MMNAKAKIKKLNNPDMVFYLYLIAMLTALFLRKAAGVNIPIYFLLFLSFIPALFGSNDNIIAAAVCCIPMSSGFQFKYALLIYVVVFIVIKQRGKLRLNETVLLIFFMMIWELLHIYYGTFSIIEYLRSFAELLFIVILFSMKLNKINYRFVFRAYAIATVGICLIMLYLQLKQHGFSIKSIFGQDFKNYRFGQANTTAKNYGLNINPNRLGLICNLSIGSLLLLIGRKEHSFFDLVLLILSTVFGLMTLSRTFVIILLLIVIFFILTTKGNLKQKLLCIFGIFTMALLVIILISQIAPNIFENIISRFKEEDMFGGRDELFSFYNRHILSSLLFFFFGIGLHDLKGKIDSIYHIDINVPHNGIQEIWVAWGIIGLILFVLMIVSLIKETRKHQHKPAKRQYLLLFITLLHIMAGQFIRSEIALLSLILVIISLSICDTKTDGKINENYTGERA